MVATRHQLTKISVLWLNEQNIQNIMEYWGLGLRARARVCVCEFVRGSGRKRIKEKEEKKRDENAIPNNNLQSH